MITMTDPLIEKSLSGWAKSLAQSNVDCEGNVSKPLVEGVLTRMVGLTLETMGCLAPIGSRCDVVAPSGKKIETEVVGFSGEKL